MGGVDTRNRFHVHWGPAEQYAERREESALRRAGRVVPDATFSAWDPIDIADVERVLAAAEYDPAKMVAILEQTQEAYGFLPVAALQHISHSTGAWYSEIYGIASYYEHLRLEPPSTRVIGICRCAACAHQGRRPHPHGAGSGAQHATRRHEPRRARPARRRRLPG